MRGIFSGSTVGKKLVIVKASIVEAIDSLEVMEAFQLFQQNDLPLNIVLEGDYSTAVHKLIRLRSFDHLRGFLRLARRVGQAALRGVLVDYKVEVNGLTLVDTAMYALFDEMEASQKRGERELPDTVKKWAGVVYFLMKITGEQPDPDRLRCWRDITFEERDRALGFCKKAYERLFTREQRERWEAEFGVVLREEASPHPCALVH